MSVRRGLIGADGTTIIHVIDCDCSDDFPKGSVALPDNAEIGWAYSASDGSALPACFPGLRAYFPSRLYGANTTIPGGNVIANTAVETAFASTIVIPANTLSAPCMVDLWAAGVHSTLLAPSLTLKLKIDGSVVLNSTAIVLASAISARAWMMRSSFLILPGAVDVQGEARFSSGASSEISALLANDVTISPNLGIDHVISLSAQWSIQNASNSIKLRQLAAFRRG